MCLLYSVSNGYTYVPISIIYYMLKILIYEFILTGRNFQYTIKLLILDSKFFSVSTHNYLIHS